MYVECFSPSFPLIRRCVFMCCLAANAASFLSFFFVVVVVF